MRVLGTDRMVPVAHNGMRSKSDLDGRFTCP